MLSALTLTSRAGGWHRLGSLPTELATFLSGILRLPVETETLMFLACIYVDAMHD
jgi:hypothetical protein